MRILVRAIQRAAEKKLRVPAEYLGYMGEASFLGFVKFLLVLPAAGHHRRRTRPMAHAVRIVTAQHEDCGSCTQIAVNSARSDGMAPEIVRAVLERRQADLPPEIALAVDFAEAVLAGAGAEEDLRLRLEGTSGRAAVVELSLAIATGRTFPTLKRGLGFAQSCSTSAVVV